MARNEMLKTYGTKDLSVGDILTTKSGGKYIVVIVDMLRNKTPKWGVISGDGEGQTAGLSNEFIFDEDGNMIIKGRLRDNGVVVRVDRFDCEPTTNRLSEALKMLTGRQPKFRKFTVWQSERSQREKDMDAVIAKVKADGYTVEQLIDYIKGMD